MSSNDFNDKTWLGFICLYILIHPVELLLKYLHSCILVKLFGKQEGLPTCCIVKIFGFFVSNRGITLQCTFLQMNLYKKWIGLMYLSIILKYSNFSIFILIWWIWTSCNYIF